MLNNRKEEKPGDIQQTKKNYQTKNNKILFKKRMTSKGLPFKYKPGLGLEITPPKNFKALSVASLLAGVITNVNEQKSVSQLHL